MAFPKEITAAIARGEDRLHRNGKPPDISVIAPGTVVGIGPKHEIEAVVFAICITWPDITYHVVWWSGNERKTEWIRPTEMLVVQPQECRIGFQ